MPLDRWLHTDTGLGLRELSRVTGKNFSQNLYITLCKNFTSKDKKDKCWSLGRRLLDLVLLYTDPHRSYPFGLNRAMVVFMLNTDADFRIKTVMGITQGHTSTKWQKTDIPETPYLEVWACSSHNRGGVGLRTGDGIWGRSLKDKKPKVSARCQAFTSNPEGQALWTHPLSS